MILDVWPMRVLCVKLLNVAQDSGLLGREIFRTLLRNKLRQP